MTTNLHPALLYYRSTREQVFPLVLVIGREPNTEMSMGSHAGPYNFREYPYTGIWNIAYSLVAEEVSLKGWKLKRICEKVGSSPIVFGNALPVGIKSAVPNKLPYRLAAQNKARQHVQNVFAPDELISRVGLVLISGLDLAEFSESREAIAEQCLRWSLPSVWLPFFRGPNKATIKQGLTPAGKAKISEIALAFLAAYPEPRGKTPNAWLPADA